MAALDTGSSDYDSDTLDTAGTAESASTKTDWARTNGMTDAIVKMQTKLGVALDGSKADLATRLLVGMDAAGKLQSPNGVDLDTRLAAEHGTDVNGKHTFKLPHSFFQDDVAASQSAVALAVVGPASGIDIEMPWAGSIVGISAQVAIADARTAGTLTVDATVNGTVTGLQAVLDGTNAQHHSATQVIDIDTFSAGDRIGVDITTDAGWLPVTADVLVVVYVSFN